MMRRVFATVPRHLRAHMQLLMREHASPGRLGFAVGVGVLLGCSPFLGFQTLVGLALGWLFGLNRLAILLGLQVSVPPLTPFVLLATAQVGARVVRGHWLPLHLAAFRSESATRVLGSLFLDMLVGTALVGGLLAITLGTLSAFGLWWLRATQSLARLFPPEQWAELRERLRGLPRSGRSYAYWKLRMDPVYALVLAELPSKGDLLDLGTGIGLLPALLGLTRPSLRIRAVEWDPRKAHVARQLLAGFPFVSVEEEDARACFLGSPGAITLLDVLHNNPISDAQRWLAECAQSLGPEGMLLIRDLEPSPWAIAPWLERIAVRVRWNRGAGVYPRPSNDLAKELTGLGLTVVRRPAGVGLFRANTLTIARRPAEPHGH